MFMKVYGNRNNIQFYIIVPFEQTYTYTPYQVYVTFVYDFAADIKY